MEYLHTATVFRISVITIWLASATQECYESDPVCDITIHRNLDTVASLIVATGDRKFGQNRKLMKNLAFLMVPFGGERYITMLFLAFGALPTKASHCCVP